MSRNYSYLKSVKVHVTDLKIGMYVGALDRDWADSSFLFQGFPIHEESDLLALRNECEFVFVDFPSVDDYKIHLENIKKSSSANENLEKRGVQEELSEAAEAFMASSKVVKSIMDSISLGEAFDVESVKSTVRSCVYSILRNKDALLVLTQIRNQDAYTAEHCMRVGIVSIAFAKYLGLSEEHMEDLGVSGMLHDVGKMKIPIKILNKPGSLTHQEMDVMKQHAELGYEILLKKRNLSPAAVDVVYTHHERNNGSGYPRGLEHDKISFNSKLIAIVDVHDAITSNRVYSKGCSATDAYKILMEGRNHLFDAKLVLKFIEWQGVYPAGSIVEMSNGQLGIVIEINPDRKLKPKVLLVTDEEKRPRPPKVVNLAKMDLDSGGNYYTIKATHADGHLGISLKEHLLRGLKLYF